MCYTNVIYILYFALVLDGCLVLSKYAFPNWPINLGEMILLWLQNFKQRTKGYFWLIDWLSVVYLPHLCCLEPLLDHLVSYQAHCLGHRGRDSCLVGAEWLTDRVRYDWSSQKTETTCWKFCHSVENMRWMTATRKNVGTEKRNQWERGVLSKKTWRGTSPNEFRSFFFLFFYV